MPIARWGVLRLLRRRCSDRNARPRHLLDAEHVFEDLAERDHVDFAAGICQRDDATCVRHVLELCFTRARHALLCARYVPSMP